MTTAAVLKQAFEAPRVLVSDDALGKKIVQEGEHLRVLGPEEVEVARVPLGHQDLATAYYDALDGTPRHWASPYLPRGLNETDARKTMTVYAAGATPAEAILGFLDSINDVPVEQRPFVSDLLEHQGAWAARAIGESCSYGVEGVLVPGGAILTRWC